MARFKDRRGRVRRLPAGRPPVTCSVRVALDEQTEGDDKERVWVQVAAEGDFNGYAGGTVAFVFDSRTFEQIIANFRNHPSYVRGADGFGMANVIPWDFHHASEMPATEGTVPTAGTPAQGWVQELTVRYGEGNKAELWALTKWLEPARSYIKEGRYQWASVSVVFDAVDARSGEQIGPVLTSVALTNQPFIEGMQKLAADRKLAERYRHGMYIEAAESPEKALEMMRCMLGLPETADAAVIVAELEKVKQWSTSGGEPPLGVDLDDIVGDLRTILNLPSLSTAEEVFVETDKLVSRLMGESGVSNPAEPAAAPEGGTPQPPPDFAGSKQGQDMTILNVLAEKFGVVPKDEAVIEAVDQLLELRGAAAEALGLTKASATRIVLKATLDDASVRAKYGPILSALDVQDPDAALDKIAKLMEESAKLTEMAPEFASLKQRQLEDDEKEMDEEVEAAVASAGVSATSEHYGGLKIALSTLRKNNAEEFAKRYPKEKLDKGRQLLGKAVSQGADPNLLTTKITAGGKGGNTPSPGNAIDVSAFEGANPILKTCNYVRASVQGADKWGWDQVHQHAVNLVRSGRVAAAS